MQSMITNIHSAVSTPSSRQSVTKPFDDPIVSHERGFFSLTSLGLALLILCCWTLLAMANDMVPFKATLHGFAVSDIPDQNGSPIHAIAVELDGHATVLGRFHDDLIHHFNVETLEFTGTSTLTSANGDAIYTEFYGQGHLTDDPDWITFDVIHTIVGGTGRFEGASGTFEGVGGYFNLVTGEDIAGYVGAISSPGSLGK